MGKIINTIITNFNGGISNDRRSGWIGNGNGFTTDKFAITKNFNVTDFPKRLVPFVRRLECAGTYKTFEIVKFLYAQYQSALIYRLYGLGVQIGTTYPKVYAFNLDAADAPNVSEWEVVTNGTHIGGGFDDRSEDVFFYYKTFIYMLTNPDSGAGGEIARFDTTEAAVFNQTYQGIPWSTAAQPVHHPSDDCAYFFLDNKVYRLDNVTWDGLVLTLPDNMKIVSSCHYGNYLAIGCVTKGSLDIRSTVFLWDRDSSLATLTERIDFGEGSLVHLANLDNYLMGVMNFYANNVFSLDSPKVLIKRANGQFATVLKELNFDNTTGTPLPRTNFVRNNRLYFPMTIILNGETCTGIWSTDVNGNLIMEYEEEDATIHTGIFFVANVLFIANSYDDTVMHSDSDKVYSTTNPSIYESLIFNAGDSSLTKKLNEIEVTFEKLPAAGEVILAYRQDGATSWTSIFDFTTDGEISHRARNIETSGGTLPQFKEIEFKIFSYGGAVITGLKFQCEIIDN